MLNDFFIAPNVTRLVTNYLERTDINEAVELEIKRHFDALASKSYLSYAQWWDLLAELDTLLDVPALGIEIGRQVKAEDCGVIGYLFKTSHNMAEALQCYHRFERLLYAGSEVETIQQNDDTVELVWSPDNGYSSLLSDALLLSGMVNVGRDILAPAKFDPEYLAFTHPIPDSEMPNYQEFFRCEIRQNQPSLSIAFALGTLHTAIPHEDTVLHSLLGKQAEAQLNQLPENDLFLISLHDTIVKRLHEGRPDANAIADALNISTRTLHRRLKSKNRVYRDVLRDVRKSMAQRYLKDDKLSLAEIALLLGYQDQSAFTRAFNDWFGQSPKHYKQKQNSH